MTIHSSDVNPQILKQNYTNFFAKNVKERIDLFIIIGISFSSIVLSPKIPDSIIIITQISSILIFEKIKIKLILLLSCFFILSFQSYKTLKSNIPVNFRDKTM